MKVAIITAHYHRGRGYMENGWANVLARGGHRVTVLTTASLSPGLTEEVEQGAGDGFRLKRLPCTRLPSRVRLAGREVEDELREMDPDLVLWINVGSHFGKAVLAHKARRGGACKLVCFFGENSGQHRFLPDHGPMSLADRAKTRGWRLIRGPLYRRAIAASDLAVGTKAETRAIIASLFSPRRWARLGRRFMDQPLGYDGEVFFWSERLRARTRRRLGLSPEDTVLIVTSRMTRRKIRRSIRPLALEIARWSRRRRTHRALIVGFGHAAASRRFREELTDLDAATRRLILYDLAPRPGLNALFNAADIGIFPCPTISVQEAMGTGLYVLLSDDGSMDHLLRSESEGALYHAGHPDSLRAGIKQARVYARSGAARGRRRAANARLDYASLSQELLARLRATHAAPSGHGVPSPSEPKPSPATQRTTAQP